MFTHLPKRQILFISKNTNTLKKYAPILQRVCNMCGSLENPICEKPLVQNQKLLKVAIIGVPNSGKSTFINNLVSRNVCATSKKVHTTRIKARAILTENDTQVVFLDTPGLVSEQELNKHRLEKSFISDSGKSLEEANLVGVIHDVENKWTRDKIDRKVIKLLEKFQSKPSFLVLNKIDALKSKRKLLDLTKLLTGGCLSGQSFMQVKEKGSEGYWEHFSDIFMVSALTGSGMNQVKEYLFEKAVPNNWLFPDHQWSDQSMEKLVVQAVQAKLLDFLPQEIPYNLKVELEYFNQEPNGNVKASVLVTCPSARMEKLIVGVNQGRLRQIVAAVQDDLQRTFDEYIIVQIITKAREK